MERHVVDVVTGTGAGAEAERGGGGGTKTLTCSPATTVATWRSGQAYQRVKYRRVKDLESNEITETPVKTRARPWWAEDKDGSILLWIKYGNQLLELQKNKSAIRVKSRDDVVTTLETINDAARGGEFDQLIQAAVGTFKKRFGK